MLLNPLLSALALSTIVLATPVQVNGSGRLAQARSFINTRFKIVKRFTDGGFCPENSTGSFPDCNCTANKPSSAFYNVDLNRCEIGECPTGSSGTKPLCICPELLDFSYDMNACIARVCPSESKGIYPDCNCSGSQFGSNLVYVQLSNYCATPDSVDVVAQPSASPSPSPILMNDGQSMDDGSNASMTMDMGAAPTATMMEDVGTTLPTPSPFLMDDGSASASQDMNVGATAPTDSMMNDAGTAPATTLPMDSAPTQTMDDTSAPQVTNLSDPVSPGPMDSMTGDSSATTNGNAGMQSSPSDASVTE